MRKRLLQVWSVTAAAFCRPKMTTIVSPSILLKTPMIPPLCLFSCLHQSETVKALKSRFQYQKVNGSSRGILFQRFSFWFYTRWLLRVSENFPGVSPLSSYQSGSVISISIGLLCGNGLETCQNFLQN